MGEAKRRMMSGFGGARPNANQLQLKIDINKEPDIYCKCGGNHFFPMFGIKYLSAIQSPNGQECMLNYQVGYACINCLEVMSIETARKCTEENKIPFREDKLIITEEKFNKE